MAAVRVVRFNMGDHRRLNKVYFISNPDVAELILSFCIHNVVGFAADPCKTDNS